MERTQLVWLDRVLECLRIFLKCSNSAVFFKDAVQRTLGHCSSRSVFYRTISTTRLRRQQLRIERLAGSFIYTLKRFRRTIGVLWWNCSLQMCLASFSRRLQLPFLRSIIFHNAKQLQLSLKIIFLFINAAAASSTFAKHLLNASPLPVRVIRIATGLRLSKICYWKNEDDVRLKDSVFW